MSRNPRIGNRRSLHIISRYNAQGLDTGLFAPRVTRLGVSPN